MTRTQLTAIVLTLAFAAAAFAQDENRLAPLRPTQIEKTTAKRVFPAPPGKGGEWEIPLTLDAPVDPAGEGFVTIGVPLLVGQADKAEGLFLLDAGGYAIPTQFRELARWWRADNSVRWLLLDFACPQNKGPVKLINKKLKLEMAPSPLQVSQTDDAITVATGPAQFVVNRKRFNLLASAKVGGVELLDAGGAGLVVEDTHGLQYLSASDTWSVTVLEQGPVRVRVRARGQFRPADKYKSQGYSKGMYDYDVFLDFFAGSTTVRLDAILCNNPPESRGDPTFEDASLTFKLAGGVSRWSLAGEKKVHAGELAAGRAVTLYQDSNGAGTWQKCQGYSGYGPGCDDGLCFKGDTVTFRGYRVFDHAAGGKVTPAADAGDDVIASGNQARGTLVAAGKAGGVVVHLKNFWEQFPKAAGASADGTVRLGLMPREYKAVHYLEDASAKGHEIFLHFFTGDAPDEAKLAAAWDRPVLARPAIEHLAATGALTDVGPYTVPTEGLTSKPDNKYSYERKFNFEKYYGNGFGWQIFGSRWRTLGGHSSRGARQPMSFDNYLYRWYTTGVREWYEVGHRTSRHFRDVRAYRIEGQDPFGFGDWNKFRAANMSEDWTSRPQPKGGELEKYHENYWRRARWWLPNPAHMTLDLPCDRYLLFGDQRAFENMRVIAGHGGNYAAYRAPEIHRATGWSWRALERYWELTGDAAAEKCLQDTLDNHMKMTAAEPKLPQVRGGVNWWFTQVYSRAVAMTLDHYGDERSLKIARWLKASVEAKQDDYFCQLNAALWTTTGEKDFRFCVVGPDGAEDSLLRVTSGGDLPATAHWLLFHDPGAK